MGLAKSEKLVFGTMDGIALKGFAESVDVFDGLPRLVVMVSAKVHMR